MLQRISSEELTEWMAYFKLQEDKEESKPESKVPAAEVMRSLYATKIVRKNDG